MERIDMIKRLKAGEKSIDLSIEKWKDILDGTGIDESAFNCACCYVDGYNGDNDCLGCPIYKYEYEQLEVYKDDDAFGYDLCANIPSETDKEGIKEAIAYLKRIKQWMIEKGEY